MNEEEQNNPVLDNDTQEQPQNPAPQVNDEHAEESTVENDEGSDNQEEDKSKSPSQPEKHDEEKMTPEEIRRLKQKISAQDRKLAELEKKTSQVQNGPTKELTQAQATELNVVFRDSPELYEGWRRKWVAQGGRDYGTYQQVYGQPVQGNQGYQQNGNSGNQPNIYQAIEDYSTMRNFLTKYPEYDAKLGKDDLDIERRLVDFEVISDTAAKLQARSKLLGEKLTEAEAFDAAVMVLNPKKALENAKDNGKIIAKQEQMLRGAGTTTSLSSGAAKSTSDVVLTDEDRAVMKRLGIKEDAFKAQKIKK